MRFAPVALALAAVISARGLNAQSITSIAPGTRVRVTSSVFHRQIGLMIGTTGDALRFTPLLRSHGMTPSSVTATVPMADLSRLEVSTGRRPDPGHGGKVGFLVGAGIGAIIGVTAYQSCRAGCFVRPSASDVLAITTVFGFGGGLIGAVVGTVHPTEHWSRVQLPASADVSVGPQPGKRVGIGLSLAF